MRKEGGSLSVREEQKELLCREPVFRHFAAICEIPHGSRNERALSDALLRWAQEQGLEAEQDAVQNVWIRRPADCGMESVPPVMLQAHIDMVCEKAPEVEHDFLRDPIRWEIDGDLLSTGGRTTLGADDGIGVAIALAILEDRTRRYPELEVLFTVGEEEDFRGAWGFDCTKMRASRIINIDNTVENVIICGSCGGMRTELLLPMQPAVREAGWKRYQLSVGGLRGGHSGEDIHRGRGNANILLARALMALESQLSYQIAAIRGGSFRLVLPREASAILWMAEEESARGAALLRELEKRFRRELSVTADSVHLELREAAGLEAQAGENSVQPGKIIDALLLMPDGIYQMNESLEGLVDTSDNLGEVYFDGESLRLITEIRSATESLRTYLFQRMQRLAAVLGGSCTADTVYPSWDFNPHSALRECYAAQWERLYGRKPEYLTVHAGLEPGCFFEGKPGTDAISIGPDCWDFHSPGETLRISSVRRVCDCLAETLAAMPLRPG